METRLQILHGAQVIDTEVYIGMLEVVKRLEQHWQLNIRHAQGEMMITHMANAMTRARHGEIIPAIDPELLNEIEASNDFANIREINNDLLSLFAFAVPQSELGYLLANVFGLYLAQADHSEV
ncbi:MAG TPA: PRD domain-containing protein [Serratia liquefaciens]|nr:PRD domain-containing protein [Serratia liquefaciens]